MSWNVLCQLVAKLYINIQSQSAEFEKMRSINSISMRALQCCKQWNVSIIESVKGKWPVLGLL